jgi:predicted acetyltransferase
MISYGKVEFVPEMKALWKTVFQEEDAYLEAFFEKVHRPENSLVYRADDKVVAALYMIPYKLVLGETQHDVAYLYAIGTLPEYRGRNFATELTKEAQRISQERGFSLVFLVPAEESLFDWYQRQGFETTFHRVAIQKTRQEVKALSGGTSPMMHVPGSSGQIWELYSRSIFHDSNWVILSEEQHSFFMETLFREGGQAWVMSEKDDDMGEAQGEEPGEEPGPYYALIQQDKDQLIIHETNIDAGSLPSFLAALEEAFDFESVIFYQPVCFFSEEALSHAKPFAMSISLQPVALNHPHLNRVLM